MTKEIIIGHEIIIEHFKKSIINDHLSHGYLFKGPEGIGKKKVAIQLARTLLCEKKGELPCEECESCIQSKSDNHPDLFFYEPDKASFKRNQIDEIQKSISIKPYGSKKIFILDNADLMTPQAQNTFLKTLEEPPSYAVIIMIVSNSQRLLPTILSRSQVISFYPLETNVIQAYLQSQYSLDETKAELYGKYANGIIGKAIKIATDEEFEDMRIQVLEWIDKILAKDLISVLGASNYLHEKKTEINDIIELLHIYFRDLLIVQSTGNFDQVINKDYEERLYNQRTRGGKDGTIGILKAIQELEIDLKTHVNYTAAIDNLLIRIQEV